MQQFDAFARGFRLVCGGPALSLFDPVELEMLVCGSPEFDFASLEQAAQYIEGLSSDSPVVKWLWAALREADQAHKKAFLHFVTGATLTSRRKRIHAFDAGSSRVPIRGLGKVVIVIQRNGPDSDRIPTAMTCFSRLLLPEYESEPKLRRLLQLALENDHGFGNI